MHNVIVTLTNPEHLRLCLNIKVPARCTGHQNETCAEAEAIAAADPMHSKYGPWVARSSIFSS